MWDFFMVILEISEQNVSCITSVQNQPYLPFSCCKELLFVALPPPLKFVSLSKRQGNISLRGWAFFQGHKEIARSYFLSLCQGKKERNVPLSLAVIDRAKHNIFSLLSKVSEEFVLQNTGLIISKNVTKKPIQNSFVHCLSHQRW